MFRVNIIICSMRLEAPAQLASLPDAMKIGGGLIGLAALAYLLVEGVAFTISSARRGRRSNNSTPLRP